MPLFQQSNDSVDQAKGQANNTAEDTKRAAGDVKDDVKQWGRSVKDTAADSWEQTKGWGRGVSQDVDRSLDSASKEGDQKFRQGDQKFRQEFGRGEAKKDQLLDLGHPLVNRIFDGFVKVAGVGAVHGASKDAYRLVSAGDNSEKSLETSAQKVGKQALQWGLVGGLYSGVTYGIEEARGVRDWKTALLGGLVTGAALSLTEPNPGSERVINGALTGAAVATAGEFLRSING